MENKAHIKVLVVDDDVLIAETIMDLLLEIGFNKIKLAHTIHDVSSVVELWKPDIALLDIRMEGLYDGIEIGKMMNDLNIPFMYITAHADIETTKKIFSTRPKGYITKPIRLNELMVNIMMVIQELEKISSKMISLKSGSELFTFDFNDFLYAKSEGNYIEVFLTNRRFVLRSSFENFSIAFPEESLIRIHRSIAVNKNHIVHQNSQELELTGKHILPISRTFAKNLMSLFF